VFKKKCCCVFTSHCSIFEYLGGESASGEELENGFLNNNKVGFFCFLGYGFSFIYFPFIFYFLLCVLFLYFSVFNVFNVFPIFLSYFPFFPLFCFYVFCVF
jgi:hypothetical protein